jgi:hypothetical protein
MPHRDEAIAVCEYDVLPHERSGVRAARAAVRGVGRKRADAAPRRQHVLTSHLARAQERRGAGAKQARRSEKEGASVGTQRLHGKGRLL